MATALGQGHVPLPVPDRLVDLQTHSTYSDGTDAPRQIVEAAAEAGLAAVALTDHDTVEGQPEMLAAGQELGVEVLPAVEISVQTPTQGVDLLGYLIDHEAPALLDLLDRLQAYRRERLPKMLDKLEDIGVPVTREEVEAQATGEVVGRPHVAKALVEAGHVETTDQAFESYIGDGRPGYVAKQRSSPEEAIGAIHAAGGLAVLAHPCFVHPAHLPSILRMLVDEGLDGIEVWYSQHDAVHIEHFGHLADRIGLVKTGGSDYHGDNKPGIEIGSGYGDLEVPYRAVEELRHRQADREQVSGT